MERVAGRLGQGWRCASAFFQSGRVSADCCAPQARNRNGLGRCRMPVTWRRHREHGPDGSSSWPAVRWSRKASATWATRRGHHQAGQPGDLFLHQGGAVGDADAGPRPVGIRTDPALLPLDRNVETGAGTSAARRLARELTEFWRPTAQLPSMLSPWQRAFARPS